jgi:hypothetical protein
MKSLHAVVILLLPLLFLPAPPVMAGEDGESQGILINQTRSVSGQAFYSGFFTVWQARDPEGVFSLLISEKPYLQNAGSSLISISYDNVVIFRQVIQLNAGKARTAGENATEYVFSRVIQAETDREVSNPDMALSGY